MSRTRSSIVVALVLMSFLGAVSSEAATRTEKKAYVSAGGDFSAMCSRSASLGVGGACFDILPTDTSVSIFVQDNFALYPAFRYEFKDASGATLLSSSTCWFGGGPIPQGATVLWVYVSQLRAGYCSFTYAGDITVTFN